MSCVPEGAEFQFDLARVIGGEDEFAIGKESLADVRDCGAVAGAKFGSDSVERISAEVKCLIARVAAARRRVVVAKGRLFVAAIGADVDSLDARRKEIAENIEADFLWER